ncbi:hypothetical protein [Lewinella sp. IMCC34183]|uniref:hypothetical protein n=1 Tax=Lewinella sp. IMCC34183 TaxID=2248762 RepID=UPI001300498C|nr:hypothetical protein [Lewinella sp. IMCC34183]
MRCFLLLSLISLTLPLFGQSIFDLLYRAPATEAVDVVLTLPLDSLQATTRGPQVATLAFADTTGDTRYLGLKVELRGRFRRSRCATPPLKLNFSKGELRDAGLAEFDKLKLVNTCYDDSTATALLLKEYLAYRAYALLSPDAHYRTQLLRLTYRDAAGRTPDRTGYAFILEDTDEMAARNGGKEVDAPAGLTSERYDPVAEATHALFQYLIANGDWSLPLHRNVKVIADADGRLVPVGYDFDFSGWVGAPYASPAADVGQQSIFQRVYLGFDQSDRTLRGVNQSFRSNRRTLLRLIDDFTLIDVRERRVLQRFVQRFYDDLATMSSSTSVLMYDQLRGTTADIIPSGGRAADYGASSRR